MNIEKLINGLNDLKNEISYLLAHEDNEEIYWNNHFDKLIKVFANEQHKFAKRLEDINNIPADRGYNIKANKLKPILASLQEAVDNELERLRYYQYNTLTVDYEYYKTKALYYDDNGIIRYIIASFLSKQEHDAFLSNLQKGLRSIRANGISRNLESFKNGYISKVGRCADENRGDGTHAVIFNNDSNVLRVHRHTNTVDMVFNWLKKNSKTGLIDEWKEYFYNELSDMGLIEECQGYDYTKSAPKVLVLDSSIDTELLRTVKAKGLKEGAITMPVEKNVLLKTDMSFLELIQTFVLDHLQSDKAHYNVGDPISDIISSPIHSKGKTLKLFPRQQVIAMGLVNAVKEGKNSLILNGGMGVGKTYISSKLAYAIVKEGYKKDKGRVIIFAQGHLIPKWKRQFEECLKPIGVNPIFYEINSFKDVNKIPQNPEGFEVFLIPKDKAKRNYQIEFAAKDKFTRANLRSISSFIKDNKPEDETKVIISTIPFSIKLMKYTAVRMENEYEKPVVLLKEQLNEEGKVKAYKIVTTSRYLKDIYGVSNRGYDFTLPVEVIKDFIREVKESEGTLIKECELKNHRHKHFQNGLCCTKCGGFHYDNSRFVFDEEKYLENIQGAPGSKSDSNNKCNNYIKADGTSLFAFEIKGIREQRIEAIYTKDRMVNPYLDEENNPLANEDLRLVKAGKYNSPYKILITRCDAKLWTAKDQKGYRTINAAEWMKKKFGKNSFDVLIADEAHIFAKESAQGITYGVLCRLSKNILNLTGTLTGGKASDLYYTLWRMLPQKMVQMGYKYSDISTFVEHYGRKKKVTKEYHSDSTYNKSGIGKKVSSGWNEIPGMSPLLYTNFLSGIMVSRTIEDMGFEMPKLRYFRHELEMSTELKSGYESLKSQMIQFIKDNEGLSIGGSYINGLLSYPDMPQQEPIYWRNSLLVANPPHIELKDKLLPKEIKLLDTIKSELKEGRRVLVYSVFSGTKGVSDRIMKVIKEAGFKASELTSSIKLEKREAWIQEQYDKGMQVIVTNPANVQTGLDIVQYPTIYFFEQPYDVKVLRQAERRAWRVGQKFECRVFYAYYKETLQEDAIKLIGLKKKSSLALEGVFSEDLLSSMGEGGESGASILYKVLQGKVQLKESELDAFGFEADPVSIASDTVNIEVSTDEKIDRNTIINKQIESKASAEQMSLFTITEEEIEKLTSKVKRKKNNHIAAGQMSFLAM